METLEFVNVFFFVFKGCSKTMKKTRYTNWISWISRTCESFLEKCVFVCTKRRIALWVGCRWQFCMTIFHSKSPFQIVDESE